LGKLNQVAAQRQQQAAYLDPDHQDRQEVKQNAHTARRRKKKGRKTIKLQGVYGI
jgi:hypothetical protein